jgi:S-DNA-T family DNA segregation ATPase FtsK/SpoIIIE
MGVACRRSPLPESGAFDRIVTNPDDLPSLLDTLLLATGPALLLMDDIDILDDPSGRITQVLSMVRPGLHIVAAGKNDGLRSQYGHWSQRVRRSRVGILLQPALDKDGELLGVRLPSRVHVPLVPGRGFLSSDGEVELIQAAR